MINNQKNILKTLLEKPLIKQRTPEWFKLRENRLTASDLYDAVHNPKSLAKKKVKNVSFNSGAIPSLKWGTMFEEMASRIYSNINNVKIHEFGLIINDNIPNFGASPDGITENGVMIEIKCPYSRKIENGKIPEKYLYQIQGQLAVCNLTDCDYVECEFECYNNQEEYLNNILDINENYKHGIIAEKKEKSNFIYNYSGNNQTSEENINEMTKYKNDGWKLNYWKLKLINIQQVEFDKNKWDNHITNKINQFIEIYNEEKKNYNPVNMFIDED
jgi:putative phage-type endonuclease